MTRNEALQIARSNYAANTKARIDFMFGRSSSYDEAVFGYRHGWYNVGAFSFSTDEITGETYDPNQGGWAFL